MITVQQALELVLARAAPLPSEQVPLASALGRVLAQPAASDMDMPPWDKSTVDGFAVRSADCPAGAVRLEVIGQVAAGQAAAEPLRPATVMRIMTGAPIPAGADAVVMVEKTRADGSAVVFSGPVKAGQNISPAGSDIRAGAAVLPAGVVLGPAQIAALAAVGCAKPTVHRVPSTAVLATGNELVDVSVKPTGAQIRNSNSWGISAQVRALGFPSEVLPPARDDVESLRTLIRRGLQHDVLILSGGVSMGEFDLVPRVLAEFGVAIHAHKVAVKPGKPFLLGTFGVKLVFGLPGNPVSTFVCFELFVAPALRRMAGHADPVRPTTPAVCENTAPAGTDRKTYLPARLTRRTAADGPVWAVERLDWNGSADLFGLARADALLIREINAPAAPAGTIVEVMPLKTAGSGH